MLAVEDMVRKVDTIESVIFQEMEMVFRLYSEVFLQQIRSKQLEDKGVDGLGIKLRTPYSERWAKTRTQAGLPTDRRTLKFTGKWYNSLKITFDSDSMTIESEGVPYSEFLEMDNGVNILRPNSEFIINLFKKEVMPRVIQELFKK